MKWDKNKLKYFSSVPLKENEMDMFVGRKEMLTEMISMIELEENFGIAGNPGTGKSTLAKRLVYEVHRKVKNCKVIYFNFAVCNIPDFLKKLAFEILNAVDDSDMKNLNLDSIKKKFLYQNSVEEFIKSLIRYEPTRELDCVGILHLYTEFLKTLDKERASEQIKFFSQEEIFNLIVKILYNIKGRLVIVVDDLDKFYFDPLTVNAGEERLAIFLTQLCDLFNVGNVSWVFILPSGFYDKYKIRADNPSSVNFLGIFSEIFYITSLMREIAIEMFEKRVKNIEKKLHIHDIIASPAFNLLLNISLGNPKLMLYYFRKAIKFLEKKAKGQKVKVNHVLSSVDYVLKLDEKNKKIIGYLAYKAKTTPDDTELRKRLNLDRLSLNHRLKLLNQSGLLDYYLDKYNQKIYVLRKLI